MGTNAEQDYKKENKATNLSDKGKIKPLQNIKKARQERWLFYD